MVVQIPPDLPQWVALGGGSAWAARRVLGGSLDVVGETLERWTRLRLQNVARVMENAAVKAGDSLDCDGTVPARVAMRVFEEGSYSDDDLVIEYLGGVLASSRTELGRDDRGNGWTRLVASLSTYELRHHYVSYSILRNVLCGREDLNLRDSRVLRQVEIFVPENEWLRAMDIGLGENVDSIHLHTVYGLRQADLLDVRAYSHGSGGSMEELWPEITEPGEIFSPTGFGILLFLWAHGAGDADINALSDPQFGLEFSEIDVEIPANARLLPPSARSKPAPG